MKYNIKTVKGVNKENLRHLMTVLYCIFSEADAYQEEAKQQTNTNNKYWGKASKKWDKAEDYLKSYIKELFKQEIKELGDKITEEVIEYISFNQGWEETGDKYREYYNLPKKYLKK